MKWYEELRLTRMPIEQIGMAFIVREVFGNDLRLSTINADEVFGPGWRAKADELRRAGIIKLTINDGMVFMKVVAHGDRKREIQREYKRKVRKNLRESKK